MPAIPASLRATHYEGTLTATPVKIDIKRGIGFRVKLLNTGSNSLDISFNNGTNWFPVGTAKEFAEDIKFHYIWLKSDSGTTYSALFFEG
jgi:hypothetical protein